MSVYNDSFRVRYGSLPIAISENETHFDTKPHIHSEIELLYVKHGMAQIFVSDKCYKVSEGELVIVNPMEVHSIICDKNMPYHQRCICFELSLLPDKRLCNELISGITYVDRYFKKDAEPTARIVGYFEKMFDAVALSVQTLHFEVTAYASLIFAELCRGGLITKKNTSGKRADFVSSVQSYLSKYYAEAITSEHIARELYYTQSYFCRLFHLNFGTSFMEYLSMYRISKAKSLLDDDTLKISEVAERVGFLDQSYFSKCFKQLVGVSPTQYKNRQHSNT